MGNQNSGKSVLVTGGGRGIGRAIVEALAADGYNVIFTARSSLAEATSLADELARAYPQQSFKPLTCDLGDKAQVETLAGTIEATAGLYGLVHNAGMPADALAAMIDQSRAEALMQVNFWSLVRLVKAALRPISRARAGRVVGIGSITAARGVRGSAAYAASKGGMASYVRALAVEMASRGVTANVIAPGYVDTEMMAPYADVRTAVEKQIPIGRYVRPSEVAALARFLLSAEAAAVTGVEIAIDGGLTAAVPVQHQS